MLLLVSFLSCQESSSKAIEPSLEVNTSYQECFPHIVEGFGDPYDNIDAYPLEQSCSGTNIQTVEDIEHVIFIGDSVTVGTYPTPTEEFYRSILTNKLAQQYQLTLPQEEWFRVDYETGQSQVLRSGDFSSCARLGARTRELFSRSKQLETCFTPDLYDKRVLVIMTMGGNDINVITQNVVQQQDPQSIWQKAEDTVTELDKGISWLKDGRFSKGIDVVFANIYEFTDGTGDATACPFADLVQLNVDIDDPLLEDIIMWLEREYFEVAKRYEVDMLFLQERFCGHGFHYDDPTTRCYLGSDADIWFDNTCLHPNPKGHAQLAEMFYSIITAQ